MDNSCSKTGNKESKIFRYGNNNLYLNSRTHIIGILNVTPDSFYDGGKFLKIQDAMNHIEKLIEEGADIIDVGGESTRPGSKPVSEEEEYNRVIPIIKEGMKYFNTIFSVDTTKSRIAYAALSEGASIINDISGLRFDPAIADVAAKFKSGLVVMHTPSRPVNMLNNTVYRSLIEDICSCLHQSVISAEDKGVDPDSILIDPGIGFGKTPEQNLIILNRLNEFRKLNKPILVGTSNKSFIGKVLRTEDLNDRDEATAATVTMSIKNGASFIRVHNVGFMKKVIKMADSILNESLN